MFVNLYHSCCNKARGFSLWARGHELSLIEVVIVFITHFEWSFAENVLRMAFAFQSRNGARALWPCWARTFLGRKWILGTVGTVSISSRAKKKKKNVASVSEDRGNVVICEKRISGLTQSIWRQSSQRRRDLTQTATSDSTTHQAMPFHLKRAFFINNFVILGAVPIGKKSVASAHFPGRGSGVGGGVSATLAGTSAKTDA